MNTSVTQTATATQTIESDANYLENNSAYISGKVLSLPQFSHELFDEKFYEFLVAVPRLSNYCDTLPITVSEKLLATAEIKVDQPIYINGQFRSYNKMIDNKSKLMLTVFVIDFNKQENQNPNNVILKGYICKPPIYRTTPFNREICDILLAVNRAYNKSDYIPCIAWGRNARFVKEVDVGKKLSIIGRIQSREYTKKFSETHSETRVAYEVSINKISADE